MSAKIHKLLEEGAVWAAAHSNQHQPVFSPTPEHQAVSFKLPAIDSALPQRGLEHAALHEWCLHDPEQRSQILPTSLTTLLAAHAYQQLDTTCDSKSKFTIWIGAHIWPSAFALSSFFPADYLKHCLFLDPKKDCLLWAIETALRSHAATTVIAACPKIALNTSKRLALAAQHGKTLGLLVRSAEDILTPSAARSQWMLRPLAATTSHPHFSLELLKYKGCQPAQTRWWIELHEQKISLSTPTELVSTPRAARTELEKGPSRTTCRKAS